MNIQKRKFELFARLQSLGFTYEEAVSLRRIEKTLHRWSEAECNGEIQRNEETGKPECYVGGNYLDQHSPRQSVYSIADREAGALRRLDSIIAARNKRCAFRKMPDGSHYVGLKNPAFVVPYHQTDPRGCQLYLLTREQLINRSSGQEMPIDSCYTNGLAVCS